LPAHAARQQPDTQEAYVVGPRVAARRGGRGVEKLELKKISSMFRPHAIAPPCTGINAHANFCQFYQQNTFTRNHKTRRQDLGEDSGKMTVAQPQPLACLPSTAPLQSAAYWISGGCLRKTSVGIDQSVAARYAAEPVRPKGHNVASGRVTIRVSE
ncbi:hypothetical protein B0H10DRAFT_1954934, partial [Mycena sp. CBHHK59/15]